MRVHNGYVLAFLGFAILATSLVMSTPFSGHSQPKAKRPPDAPAAETLRRPTFLPLRLAEEFETSAPQAAITTVQETGPILFKEGELEAYLTFPVPVGKRMILESVSARTEMTPGQTAAVQFTTTAGGGSASFALPMAYQGRYEKLGDVSASALRLRAYADGGTVITFRIHRSAVGDLASGFISITGVLESR
jgi:hypothetical protein